MSNIANYTLFYNADDGKMYAGSCREEKEVLVDVKISEAVEISGYRGDGLTLTLTGLEFETTADMALVVPANTTIVLESGVSRLIVHAQGPEANVGALYVKGDLTITGGEGKLICDTTSTNRRKLFVEPLHLRALCRSDHHRRPSGGLLRRLQRARRRAVRRRPSVWRGESKGRHYHHRRFRDRRRRAPHHPRHQHQTDHRPQFHRREFRRVCRKRGGIPR